jgi:hypothetical protein
VLASYLTYYVIRPGAHKSYGELIEPQRPLPQAQAWRLDGQPVALSSLKGQWLLISVAGGACDAQCERHLYLQRQLRESLGKDKDRLDWVWLVPDEAPLPPALLPALGQATCAARDARTAAPVAGAGTRPGPGRAPVPGRSHGALDDALPARLDLAGAAKAKRDLERLMRALGQLGRGRTLSP